MSMSSEGPGMVSSSAPSYEGYLSKRVSTHNAWRRRFFRYTNANGHGDGLENLEALLNSITLILCQTSRQ